MRHAAKQRDERSIDRPLVAPLGGAPRHQVLGLLVAPLCGATHLQALCAAVSRGAQRPLMRHAAKQRDEKSIDRPLVAPLGGAPRHQAFGLLVAPLGGATRHQALCAAVAGARSAR